MNFWEYLDRVGERAVTHENRVLPADFRGWVALGLFTQSTALFAVMSAIPELLDSQAFTTLATAIIVTGWIGGVAAFAYSAGKQQGEDSALAKQAMNLAATATGNDRQSVPKDAADGAQQSADAAQNEADNLAARASDGEQQ